MRKRIFFLFFLAYCLNKKITAQTTLEIADCQAMSNEARFEFIASLPYGTWDSTQTVSNLGQLLPIIEEKKDTRSYIYCLFIKYISRNSLCLSFEDRLKILNEMKQKANKSDYIVEAIVAEHYIGFEYYTTQQRQLEQQYVAILKEQEEMQHIGFEQFIQYRLEAILLHNGNFMRDLEDPEKAFPFYSIAERFIKPTIEGHYYYTMVLNNIQTYYCNKKDYTKAIKYAQKIYDFHYSLNPTQDIKIWRTRFWQGLSSLDIAAMMIEMGKADEAEQYSIRGYELCKLQGDIKGEGGDKIIAEFDALQVLISIKLKLGKANEAEKFLQRAMLLMKAFDSHNVTNYFKPLKLYRNYVRFYEAKNDLNNAFRFAKLAETMQDSLDHRNDAHKLEKITQRLEAEKYTTQIKLVEGEKQLQKWLKNAAILIMLLVIGLAAVNYRRILNKRKLALQELEAERKTLASLTNSFREKSDLADSLRIEMERLSNAGERSEYLEQLTKSTILTDEDWLKFRTLFEKVHPQFINEQKTKFPDLTAAELRLLVLEKLQLGTQEMANMLGVSRNTINQTKVRLRRKIG